MLRKAILLFIFLLCQPVLASESDLVISEIMYDVDGSDASHEWIEIYNTGTENVIASSTWRFFDSSNHKISLYQGTSTIAGNEFFVLADKAEQFLLDYPEFNGNIYDTVMSLVNSSSSIAISFDNGLSYSLEESYDPLWGANGNGYSLELARSTNNWQESNILGGTPGKINSEVELEEIIIVEDPEQSREEEESVEEERQDWSQLVINEFLPNPAGSDSNEWIELYNKGQNILNLEGLKIKDNSTRVFTIDIDSNLDLNLLANHYLLIPKSISGIALNNSNGDGVIIMDPDNNIIDSVSYNDNVLDDRSYARSDDAFVWTKTATPGAVNQILINQVPVAQISLEEGDFVVGEKLSFSASKSYDPEGEDLDYYWEFGDDKTSTRENIKHSFDSLGAYTVTLTVTDSEESYDKAEFLINIFQSEETPIKDKELLSVKSTEKNIDIDIAEDDLIISEFIPNPIGSDDNEWIELYNASDRDIDLYTWQLDDMEGGSKPWEFSTSTIIKAQDYLLLNRQETKITLNNTSDSVRILSPSGDIWQDVEYEKIPEGKSYAWDIINNEWVVNDPSPGIENNFEVTQAIEIIYGVAEINDSEKNQEIIVQGIAINDTNKDIRSLYLADYNFSSINFEELVEIYSYYKDFPDIKVGELVTVSGKISKLGDLPRIKIKTKTDVWKNDINIDLLEPEIIEVEDIDEDLLGDFINIKGIVVRKSGKNVYLASDIEEEYIVRVYSKFSTKELEIKKGDEMIVAGILSETDSGFKLVPFKIGDISVSKQVLGEKIEAENYEEQAISTSTSQVIIENKKANIKNVLIFIITGAFIVALVYFIKNKKREV